jgi:general secretion pathway protein L
MTLQELLNADVGSIGEWARQGFAWWLDELASLAPAGWREALSARPRNVASPASPAGWRLWRNGRLLNEAQAGRRRPEDVALILPTDAVLVRRLEFPRLPLADIRRMVALDLERLSPLAPGLVFHDIEVVDRDAGEGRQSVLLGVVPRMTAMRWLDAARADGLSPVRLGAAIEDGSPAWRFDFLPALKAAAGEKDDGRVVRYWWAGVAALLLINVGVLVARDMIDVSQLRQTVDAQAAATDAASQLRHRVQSEENARRDLIARQMQGDPLHVIDALSRAIPASAWVQRLEWNGQSVRVVGFKNADVDVAGALRASPLFINPRLATAETSVKPGATPPFDITADVAGKRSH